MKQVSGSFSYTVIVGCGRLGGFLSEELSRGGSDVVVVDSDPASFAWLSDKFSGFTIEGDATELSVLEKAGLQKADLCIAVSESDNINILVAQVALRHFNVKKVIARINDPVLGSYARMQGVNVFSPPALAADYLLDLARSFGEDET